MPCCDIADSWLRKLESRPPEILDEKDLKLLCDQVKLLLMQENNVYPVSSPVTICGDIHGQFHDLLELFRIGNKLPQSAYIFLGDYVDRGRNSVETIEYLLALKVKYPSLITLIRGNHECRQITTVYGFYDECMQKYGNANAWKYCIEVFDFLALAALIDNEVLCVHGGLSPEVRFVDQLRVIERVQEIPFSGAFSDLVWSDPENVDTWEVNSRGAGWLFGGKVTKEFNHLNGLTLIARAHQLVMDGFQYMFEENSLITIWSAPNYCYRCRNVAAIMHLDSSGARRMYIFRETEAKHAGVQQGVISQYFD